MFFFAITGGTTLFPGFASRMEKELVDLCPNKLAKSVRVISPDDRRYLVFKGGAVLTNLSSFSQQWVFKDEYREFGPNIVHKKCFWTRSTLAVRTLMYKGGVLVVYMESTVKVLVEFSGDLVVHECAGQSACRWICDDFKLAIMHGTNIVSYEYAIVCDKGSENCKIEALYGLFLQTQNVVHGFNWMQCSWLCLNYSIQLTAARNSSLLFTQHKSSICEFAHTRHDSLCGWQHWRV